MIGNLFKFGKKKPPPVTTIPLSELAKIWRDPVELEGVIKKETHPKPRTGNKPVQAEPSAVDLAALIVADQDPISNNKDEWFHKEVLMESLQSRIPKGRTSAFVYQDVAYYNLETVTKALNEQRLHRNHKPLTSNEVISFLKPKKELGLKNNKYLLRFDKGLPIKTFLYTHLIHNKDIFEPLLPTTDSGRRLKSIKPIKAHTS